MAANLKIIHKTHVHHGRGEFPSRMVLLKHLFRGKVKEYSVHMSAKYESGWGYYGGWYFRPEEYGSHQAALKEAKRKFNIRLKRYPEFRGEAIKG